MAVMTPAEVTSTRRLDVPPPGRYRISPADSSVTIRTRHLFGLGAVRATLALRDGRVLVGERPEASTAAARFAVPTFDSGNQARDAAVLSPRLLDAEAYPSLSFTSTELVSEQGQWSLRGELEVRGVTRLVEARIRALESDGATLRVNAQVSINRYDFGITAYRGLAARRLTVDLAVTAYREES
jgi:polyisoprenoid-binding protein YceI